MIYKATAVLLATALVGLVGWLTGGEGAGLGLVLAYPVLVAGWGLAGRDGR